MVPNHDDRSLFRDSLYPFNDNFACEAANGPCSERVGETHAERHLFATGNEVIFDNAAGGTITIAPDMSPLSTTVNAAVGSNSSLAGGVAGGVPAAAGGGRVGTAAVAAATPATEAPHSVQNFWFGWTPAPHDGQNMAHSLSN